MNIKKFLKEFYSIFKYFMLYLLGFLALMIAGIIADINDIPNDFLDKLSSAEIQVVYMLLIGAISFFAAIYVSIIQIVEKLRRKKQNDK